MLVLIRIVKTKRSLVRNRDFGFITMSKLLDRSSKMLTSTLMLDRMEPHRQFYNWYDTGNMKPLYPRYVSSVDSGNLAALTLILKTSLHELANVPLLRPALFRGWREGDLVCISHVLKHWTETGKTKRRRRASDIP